MQPAPASPFAPLSALNYPSLSSLESVLSDTPTLSFFHKCLTQTPLHHKTVLHLSSDLNVFYSLFAARAGAAKVYCVLHGHSQGEKKNKHMMEQMVRENGCEGVVEVVLWAEVGARVRGKVDVLVGEPMGVNMWVDGGLDWMIDARDGLLAQGGVIIPGWIKYKCALVLDEYQKDEKVEFWNEVHGVAMTQMKNWVTHEPIIRTVDPTLLLTHPHPLAEFDLHSATYLQLDHHRRTLRLAPLSPDHPAANGLTIWFQAGYQLEDGSVEVLDSSPWCEQTRWTHMTLYTRGEWKLQGEKKVPLTVKKSGSGVVLRLGVEEGEEVYVVG